MSESQEPPSPDGASPDGASPDGASPTEVTLNEVTPNEMVPDKQPPDKQPLTRREAREAAKGGVSAPQDAPTQAFTVADVTEAAQVPSGQAATEHLATEQAATEQAATEQVAKAGVSGQAIAPGAKAGVGVAALFAKHPKAWLFSTLGVVFLMLGTGAVFAGSALGPTSAAAFSVSSTPTTSPTTEPPRPVPADAAAATRLRTCSIAGPAADGRLGTFAASVVNATTGEVLYDRAAGTLAPTASVMKTLIAATALKILGPDYQLSTKVYAGSSPGTVVLVGGGDPTLSAGGGTVYTGAPQLSDLAAQVRGQFDEPITEIILDATLWNNSDAWDPSWPANERTLGFQPLIVPLMVDGDRQNPTRQDSPRSTDPVTAAGKAFASALDVPDAKLSLGSAITTNKLLGEVKSQPVKTLIGQMLPVSDNTLAEMLARVSSKVGGKDGSAASLTGVVTSALTGYGITAPGLAIKDGSGESKNDGVPPLVVAQLMTKVLAGANNLDVIYKALPVSGKTGTLASRFTGPNAVARGAVNAKTGSIANVYTLGGIVHAADGTPLAFAFYALGKTNSAARPALDTVTTAVFNCGDNLSNN